MKKRLRKKGPSEPIFIGKLDVPDFVCQECGYIVARGLELGQFKDLLSYCPKCGTFLHR